MLKHNFLLVITSEISNQKQKHYIAVIRATMFGNSNNFANS